MADALPRDPGLDPAVSVIIIFYNAERFLEEAIDSVIRQTEHNWELLLADDGSSDSSTAIARNYACKMGPPVRYFEHPGHRNRGMSATRNLALRNSRGEWVTFLDADDVWTPNKLAEQLQLLASHPDAGLLYGSPLYWFSWSKELSRFKDCYPGVSVPPESLVYPPGLMLRNYPLGKGPAPCPSDIIVRRSLLDQVAGFEESFGGAYQMYEDQAFLAKVYLSTAVYVSGRCWTYYRQHSSACSTVVRDSGQYPHVRQFFLEYLERYLRAQAIIDPKIWTVLERAWWPYHHPRLAAARDLFNRAMRRLRRYLRSALAQARS
jgi:glycosyltransferase involved in cell wall biosynthesis